VTCFKKISLAIILVAFFYSCSYTPERQLPSRGESIVDSAIAFHGGKLYDAVELSFGFRGRDYRARIKDGSFEYTNAYRDTLGENLRRLDNSGFSQSIDGKSLILSKKDSMTRAASINSVLYFALLPGQLKSASAKKEYLGEEKIDGKVYFKVRVTFTEDGGGEDFEDIFLYWFSKDDYSMDYLAYSYLEEEGGTRFRKAYDSRSVNGLIFQNYVNFEGPTTDSLMHISEMYKSGLLDTLSLIEVDRLLVEPL
jgi:hypothetical protein